MGSGYAKPFLRVVSSATDLALELGPTKVGNVAWDCVCEALTAGRKFVRINCCGIPGIDCWTNI